MFTFIIFCFVLFFFSACTMYLLFWRMMKNRVGIEVNLLCHSHGMWDINISVLVVISLSHLVPYPVVFSFLGCSFYIQVQISSFSVWLQWEPRSVFARIQIHRKQNRSRSHRVIKPLACTNLQGIFDTSIFVANWFESHYESQILTSPSPI